MANINIEYLKNFFPLITFFLGVMSIPFAEYLKDRYKSKKIAKHLKIELIDESKDLKKSVKKIADALRTTGDYLRAKKSSSNVEVSGAIKLVPRPVYLHFLNDAIDNSYAQYDEQQRFSLKTIKTMLIGLEIYSKEIAESNWRVDEGLDSIQLAYKKYIRTASSTIRVMEMIAASKGYELASDKELVESVLSEMEIKLSFSELAIVTKEALN